jgi:hypothetical protein
MIDPWHRDATEPDGPDGMNGDKAVVPTSGDAIMRSYVLTAALAAALLSTSLTLGYANTSELTSPNSRPTEPTKTDKGKALGDDQSHGITDEAPPVVLYPQGSMTQATRAFTPKAMTYHRVIHNNPRLSLIDNELGKAAHRVEADRHHGYLTAMEARKVRAEEQAIRTAAATTAERNGGRLPEAQFVSLQERVTDLNQMIHRYANNSAHA